MVRNDADIQRKCGIQFILRITVRRDAQLSSVYSKMGSFLDDGGVFDRTFVYKDAGEQRTYLTEEFKKK